MLGVSNVSFGLNPAARRILNSVFLHEAVEAGLGASSTPGRSSRSTGSTPNSAKSASISSTTGAPRVTRWKLLELFAGVETVERSESDYEGHGGGGAARQAHALDGDQKNVITDLDVALGEGTEPLDIINNYLLDGMRTVGDLFRQW